MSACRARSKRATDRSPDVRKIVGPYLLSDDEMVTIGERRFDTSEDAAPHAPIEADAQLKFPAAIALLEQAQQLRVSVENEDAEDIRNVTADLRQAISAGDEAAVASLSAELDDILFYVQ